MLWRDLLMAAATQPSGGVSYSAEATALFARMSVAPDATRKGHINTLIVALKNAGIWTKLDAFYILAAHDAQAARLNWVSTSYNLSAVNSPTFTTDRGYTGDGATSYLDTGFDPTAAASPNYVRNSAHLSLWSRTSAQGAPSDMGGDAGAIIVCRSTINTMLTRINNVSSTNLANTDGSGHFIGSRTGALATDIVGYRNGSSLGSPNDVSVAPASFAVRLLGRANAPQFSTRQEAGGSIGSGLNGTEASAFYNAMQTYMTAVGA